MERRDFGKTEMRVSILGLGTAEIGFSATDEKTVDALLASASDGGINVLDTAAMYAGAEEMLGRLLRHRRKEFFVFTKCGRHVPRAGMFERVARKLRHSFSERVDEPPLEWHPKVLLSTIEQSLGRLGIDAIDLLQLHSCSEELLRRGDVIDVLHRARAAGKVRYVGYSGDGDAARWAVESGHFDALQVSVNIADQEPLDDILPRAVARGLGVIAKRSLANALWKDLRRPEDPHMHAYWDRLRYLDYEFLGGDEAFATAVRFTLATGVHTAIIGTTNPRNLEANIRAARRGPLEPVEYELIRARWNRISCPDWGGQT